MTPRMTQAVPLPNIETATTFASTLAPFMSAPSVLLLSGDIGTGKSHFARTLMRSLGVTDQDIPSPTFTLVQTYDSDVGPIWHSDLYRLSSPEEAEELGLYDAFDTAICLVEWPDRLGADVPQDALSIAFDYAGVGRIATLSTPGSKWAALFAAIPE